MKVSTSSSSPTPIRKRGVFFHPLIESTCRSGEASHPLQDSVSSPSSPPQQQRVYTSRQSRAGIPAPHCESFVSDPLLLNDDCDLPSVIPLSPTTTTDKKRLTRPRPVDHHDASTDAALIEILSYEQSTSHEEEELSRFAHYYLRRMPAAPHRRPYSISVSGGEGSVSLRGNGNVEEEPIAVRPTRELRLVRFAAHASSTDGAPSTSLNTTSLPPTTLLTMNGKRSIHSNVNVNNNPTNSSRTAAAVVWGPGVVYPAYSYSFHSFCEAAEGSW